MTTHSNPVLEAIARHRSVRSFKPTEVPAADIEAAVSAAQMAATSSWIQAYSLLQVRDAHERDTLRELTGDQAQVVQAGAFFCVNADLRRHYLIAEDAGVEVHHNLETFMLGVIDAALFAQNLTLAFEALGYGCCYIGGLRTRIEEVDALLRVPKFVYPLFGLCVGETDHDTGQRPRLPVDAVWMRDRYASDEEVRAWMKQHDEEAGRYYEQRGAAGRNWTGGIWRKFRRAQREQLLSYYTQKGAHFR